MVEKGEHRYYIQANSGGKRWTQILHTGKKMWEKDKNRLYIQADSGGKQWKQTLFMYIPAKMVKQKKKRYCINVRANDGGKKGTYTIYR